jgi:hypothetical protein
VKIEDGPAAVTGDKSCLMSLSYLEYDGKAHGESDPEVRRPA